MYARDGEADEVEYKSFFFLSWSPTHSFSQAFLWRPHLMVSLGLSNADNIAWYAFGRGHRVTVVMLPLLFSCPACQISTICLCILWSQVETHKCQSIECKAIICCWAEICLKAMAGCPFSGTRGKILRFILWGTSAATLMEAWPFCGVCWLTPLFLPPYTPLCLVMNYTSCLHSGSNGVAISEVIVAQWNWKKNGSPHTKAVRWLQISVISYANYM